MFRRHLRQASALLGCAAIIAGVFFPWSIIHPIFRLISPDNQIDSSFLTNIDRLLMLALVILGTSLLVLASVWRGFEAALLWLFHLPARRFMVGVVLLAFVLRFAWLLVVPTEPISDYGVYHLLGRNVAMGVGYVNDFSPAGDGDHAKLAYRPPGLPYLLAAVYKVFGVNYNWGKLLMLGFSLILVVLTYQLGATLFNDAVGRIAAVGAAILPSLITFTSVLNTEIPCTVFLLLTLWLLARAVPNWRLSTLILAGVSLGIGSLIRPVGMLLPVALFIYMWAMSGKWRGALLNMIILQGVTLLTILPWSLRNTSVLGSFVLISTNSGQVLWEGSVTTGNGGYYVKDSVPDEKREVYEARLAAISAAPELEFDALYRAWALDNIRENPFAYLAYGFRRKMVLLYLFDYEPVTLATNKLAKDAELSPVIRFAAMAISEIVYLIIGLFTLSELLRWRTYKHQPQRWLLLLTCLYWSAVHFVFTGQSGYHTPVLPIFAVFAGYAMYRLALVYEKRVVSTQPTRDLPKWKPHLDSSTSL